MEEQTTPVVDHERIIQGVAEALAPQQPEPAFEELDYDAQIKQLSQQVEQANKAGQHAQAIVIAQQSAPKVAAEIVEGLSDDVRADAQRLVDEKLRELAVQNPQFITGLTTKAKEELADWAFGKVGRSRPRSTSEPIGEIPQGIEGVPKELEQYLKSVGVTDPERIKAAAARYRSA